MPKSFYDYGDVFSRNGVYNFIVGARGLGKTYGAKVRSVKAYLKKGDQFIYLRRYATELKSVRNTFMADILHEFPGYEFKPNGDELLVRKAGDDKAPWHVMAYFVALSKAQQKKSVSYAKVKTIIFDEFIIERGAIHYLPDEARAFNDFYSTVDRYQDKTRVFFLANSVSIMNPYFLEWKIEPENGQEWITRGNGFIIAHFPDSEAFTSEVFETRFGKFISGTDYAGFAVANEFRDNGDALISRKSETAKYYFTLETVTGTFSVWVDTKPSNGPIFYVQEKRPREENFWTLIPQAMSEGKTLVLYSDRVLQSLRSGYSRARVYFDKPQTRNAFAGIYKR